MSDTDPPRVLVTRPLPQAERTAEKLRQMGYAPILAPMLRIEPIEPPTLPNFTKAQAVLVTSINGLDRLAALTPERSTPILTVGDRTASAAKNAGFLKIRSASGDGYALMDLARQHLTPNAGAVIHIRGRHAAVEFDSLTDLGFQFEEVTAYQAIDQAELPDSALSRVPAAALIYSQRTAEALAEAMQKADFDLTSVAMVGISPTALAPLSASGARRKAAKSPNEAALLAALSEIVSPAGKN